MVKGLSSFAEEYLEYDDVYVFRKFEMLECLKNRGWLHILGCLGITSLLNTIIFVRWNSVIESF